MPAPTLEGRLLCASGYAYGITTGGPLVDSSTNVYYPGAGFLAPPVSFATGEDLIDGCLVGTTQDGVVLAFRGTLSFDLISQEADLDWLDDFNDIPVPLAGFPGQVHRGFSDSLALLWDDLLSAVQAQRAAAASLATAPVLVTGHSKGGALAALAAWKLQDGNQIPVKVVTIAAARTGDMAFATAYNAKVDHTRYEYNNDIVPHVPPSEGPLFNALVSLAASGSPLRDLQWFNYQPVGTLRYITAQEQIVGDSVMLHFERETKLAEQILEFHYAQIIQDHSIACGSGYMRAICPTGVCP